MKFNVWSAFGGVGSRPGSNRTILDGQEKGDQPFWLARLTFAPF